MSGLPKGWVATKLGNLIEMIMGQAPPGTACNKTQEGTVFVKAGEFGIHRPIVREWTTQPLRFGKSTDVFLCVVGATAGKINLGIDCAIGRSVAALRPADTIDQFFLYYFLATKVLSLRGDSNGSAQGVISKPDIASIEIGLPPLAEQRRIVAKVEALFSELEAGVAALKQARAQLAVYRQALLRDAFEGRLTADWRSKHAPSLETGEQLLERIRERHTESGEPISDAEAESLPQLPEGWCHARFGEFIQAMSAGKSFSCEERPPRSDEIGVAKVSAVTWGEYLEEESKTCRDASKINPSYFIQAGDFLLSRANTIDLVGASVIVKHVTKRIMLSDKTLRLTIEGIPPYFLLYYLRSRQGRREIMSRSTGNQESMRNIGQDRIRSIIVPVCSEAEALKIVEVLEAQLSELDALETDIDVNLGKAEALRQAILKKAFAGELVPQDPADEPAAALLARIQAEREAASSLPRAKAKMTRRKTKA